MTNVDSNGIPIAPDSLRLYDSYTQDPPFTLYFTYVWVTAAGLCALLGLPRLLRSLRSGRFWAGIRGIGWNYNVTPDYQPIGASEKGKRVTREATGAIGGDRLRGLITAMAAWSLYSPQFLRLDIGQIVVLLGYLSTLLVCITKDAQLVSNANRAGFLAVSQLPLLFLLSTKNNVLAALMGRGYEKLNFLHRWSGRAVFLSATIHGSLWIRNHLALGASLTADKEMKGLSAYAVLCLMVLISLRPVRNAAYQVFFVSHVVGFVTFFILVCHHTPYAQPWIFPAIAFYGLDMLLRFLRFRFKPATLSATDNQISMVTIDNCDFGWVAGQHVRLRLLFGAQVFESHPLSICNAPSLISNIPTTRGQILLGIRVVGDWSSVINTLALTSSAGDNADEAERCCVEKVAKKEVMVMIDGPYGGISFDLGRYEHVLLVAGGAGITFALGVLDDLVGRIIKLGRQGGERTKKIQFAWCVRSFGCIRWFESQLEDIASAAARESFLDLHMTFFVTCHCVPEAVPNIENSEVTIEKPSISRLLEQFVSGAAHGTGGVGVATSGPESLVSEARNSVARLGTRAAKLGGIALHTEVFSL